MVKMPKRPNYPFVPISTAYIEPGHFWSIPLSEGGYACGRVIQLCVKDKKRNSRTFLAGLMDWSGDARPTSEAIAGCSVIEQGQVHIKTIKENGGEILGFRDLALDGIEPSLFRDSWGATYVQRGFDCLRPFDRKKDADLPVFSTWGFGVIKILAEKKFGGRRRPRNFLG
jgi:hypothetical protein